MSIVGCRPPSDKTQITVNFSWTAVGENGNIGTAAAYDMRYSNDSLILKQWNNAKQLTGLPKPNVAGILEQYSTRVVIGKTYYFAIKTVNHSGYWSPISNIKVFNSLTSVSNFINFNH